MSQNEKADLKKLILLLIAFCFAMLTGIAIGERIVWLAIICFVLFVFFFQWGFRFKHKEKGTEA